LSSEAFVETDWLLAHLDDPHLRIVDARSTPHGGSVEMRSGRDEYAAGHLPGAVYLDYAEDLDDPATPYAERVAPPELFARRTSEAGIGDDATVVVYDAGTVPFAARLVWMLRYYGHDAAFVLAGGIGAWTAAGRSLTTEEPRIRAARFTPRPIERLRATRDEVLAVARGESDAQLLETQRDATYAQRDRDIAGCIRLSANVLLEDARGGRITSDEKLRQLIAEAGIDPKKRTITSCGSGVSASGAWLALRAAGFEDVAVYDGSWLEWIHDDLPTVPKHQ